MSQRIAPDGLLSPEAPSGRRCLRAAAFRTSEPVRPDRMPLAGCWWVPCRRRRSALSSPTWLAVQRSSHRLGFGYRDRRTAGPSTDRGDRSPGRNRPAEEPSPAGRHLCWRRATRRPARQRRRLPLGADVPIDLRPGHARGSRNESHRDRDPRATHAGHALGARPHDWKVPRRSRSAPFPPAQRAAGSRTISRARVCATGSVDSSWARGSPSWSTGS